MKKLKLFSAFAAALALSVGSAIAADMSPAPAYKAPPPPPAVWDWTGFYIGGAIGYGLWSADTQAVGDPTAGPPFAGAALTSTITNGGRGWVGQINGGFDYQFNQYIVAGVFADWDPSSISGTLATATATNFFNPLGGTEKESSSWAVGARIGLITLPGLFSYVNGGYTQARFDALSVGNLAASPLLIGGPFAATIASHDYHGWFVGGGVESRLTFLPINGLFLRTEYRYSSFDAATLPLVTAAGTVAAVGGIPTDLSIKPYVQTIMSGLEWKFNWAGH